MKKINEEFLNRELQTLPFHLLNSFPTIFIELNVTDTRGDYTTLIKI